MLVVDLGLIVIGVAGMIQLKDRINQLWITFAETIILSVLDICLSGYELFKLKDYLKYT